MSVIPMWIFLPGGLLMPAAVPADKVDAKWLGPNGDFDLQIRVRAVSHLENFIRDYLDPMGIEHSEIQKTPEMDYNARAYVRNADFGEALRVAVSDIDYLKFKPTAEDKDEDGNPLYAEGKEYHSVLNSIWGTVTRLGRPGGVWATGRYGAYGSAYGPTSKSKYGRTWSDWWGGKTRDSRRWKDEDYDLVQSAKRGNGRDWVSDDIRDGDALWGNLTDDDRYEDWDDLDRFSPDYVPASATRSEKILDSVAGIPATQWEDYLSQEELTLVEDVYTEALDAEIAMASRAGRHRMSRAERKAAKRRQRALVRL